MVSRLSTAFRQGKLWRSLRDITFLRSAVYLFRELRRSKLEPRTTSKDSVDSDFRASVDPFHYDTSPENQARFRRQKELLDSVRGSGRFRNALEIGCAEGHFTEVIADRSQSLLVLDLSSTALARARKRRNWGESVTFREWDLKSEAIPGRFDLIVLAGVLEYFYRRSTFKKVRASLVGALNPGGYLLLESRLSENPTVADAWWSKYLIRGKWANAFIASVVRRK
jgi:predicted TPR repeat methyltransferase